MSEVFDSSDKLFYKFAKSVCYWFFKATYRVHYIGAENIPVEGGLVIASNHIHNLDPVFVGLGTSRFVHFMAKEELFRIHGFAQLIRYLGAFPVRRGQGDRGAIRHAIAVPQQGGCIVIFPEGHRSKDGQIHQGQTGVAMIARKAGCPIVPVAVVGPYRFRRRLTLRVGIPFLPGPEDTNETVLGRVMESIQALHREGHAQ